MNNKEAWQDDLLNRKSEGEFLINYLLKRYEQNKNTNFILNINATWGFGKTYFLENLALDLKSKRHPVIYFDAWKNDFSNDPLLAFISEIDTQLTDYFPQKDKTKKTIVEGLKKVKRNMIPMLAGVLANRLTHYGADTILDDETTEEKEGTDTSKTISKSSEKMALQYAQKALLEHKSVKKV